LAAREKIHIIGIGDDGLVGLTQAARDIIGAAQLIVGSAQTLSAVLYTGAELREVSGDLDALVSLIDDRSHDRIVVLTTGDPLFFGVARYLCERLGKDRFEVIPHVSMMQTAFARIKESWDEAYLANLASIPLERAVEKMRSAEKAGLFTTEQISPADVAAELSKRGIDYFTAFVCENLGSPDERVTQAELNELSTLDFAPLNVLILVRKPDVPDKPREAGTGRLFGNPDELFLQSKPKRGLLTPTEVRVIALSLMELQPNSIVWDVGAGSGSVSIEAARIAREGTVYAIEMDPEDHQLIQENAARFAVPNVVAVMGKAPEAWQDLPDADAIFVGGTGREVSEIAAASCPRLRPGGRIVVNCGSISNLSAVPEALAKDASDVEVRMVNIALATNQLDSVRFESQNPTFLISARRT
jgi:precorrin-6Y C5,15-methyltransferase (decarboxylating)